MTQILSNRRTRQAVIGAAVVLCALCALARDTQQGRQMARTQFETAERMREALNGKPSPQRTRREYQQVSDAYRRVYFMSPGSSKTDPAWPRSPSCWWSRAVPSITKRLCAMPSSNTNSCGASIPEAIPL